MKLTDIDELFKIGMDESERRSENHLIEAKPRVWEAIQIPKQKSMQHWLLMSSIAAAVTMFMIASVLYLKLDSKQQELEALQEVVTIQVPSFQKNKVNESLEQKHDQQEETAVVPKEAPAIIHHRTIADTESKTVTEDNNPRKAEPTLLLESPKVDLMAQLDPLISLPDEIGLEPVSIPQASTASAITPKPKKRGKLRLKIGNGTSHYDSQNSLALYIKL